MQVCVAPFKNKGIESALQKTRMASRQDLQSYINRRMNVDFEIMI